MPTELVSIHPEELKFPFELRKQISCSLQLVNNTDNYVAFKVKTTSPKKYCVRPNTGIVLPRDTCEVTVTMQSQREAPPDFQCKDKFLVQSVIAPDDANQQEVSQELFNKEPGREISETKLRVVYVPPPQQSPTSEVLDQSTSPGSFDNGDPNLYESGKDFGDLKVKLAEYQSQATRLTEEKRAALQQNERLQEEIRTLLGKSGGRISEAMPDKPVPGFSFLFVLAIGLLGILVGYFLHS